MLRWVDYMDYYQPPGRGFATSVKMDQTCDRVDQMNEAGLRVP
jgi:hypothetical protein